MYIPVFFEKCRVYFYLFEKSLDSFQNFPEYMLIGHIYSFFGKVLRLNRKKQDF
jgi:hypothetical protein